MKGWRFYEEYKSSKRKVPTGNVIAVSTAQEIFPRRHHRACAAAVYQEPNAPVCGADVDIDYLRYYCKRTSEAKARKIHPKLFEYLEGE